MAHTIEGNSTIGYRVIDDKIGALSGRKKTEADAYEAAGIKPKPRARGAKETAEEPSGES